VKAEESKLQDDLILVNKKASKLQEEFIDITPLKFKELGKSFEAVSADIVNRIQFFQNDIEQLKMQETTLLPTWKQDLFKRESDLATMSAKLSLGHIRNHLLLMESEEKLDEDIETEEGALIVLRRRIMSIRRHSNEQQYNVWPTTPPSSVPSPQVQPTFPSMAASSVYNRGGYQPPHSYPVADKASSMNARTITTTTITKTLIEEEVGIIS